MSKRYFTRDCPACPFWDENRCTMTAECSTFQDLFAGGEFISTIDVLMSIENRADGPNILQDAYYVDRDGVYVDRVDGDRFDVALYLGQNLDIVGVIRPKN